MTATNRVGGPISAPESETIAPTAVQEPCYRGRDWNGRWIRASIRARAPRRATTIGRRKVGISHPKLQEVLHQDFADCSALAEVLSDQHAAIFCLGAYTGTVSDTESVR